MTLAKRLSDDEFEKLSTTKKKQHVAKLLIEQSGATPIPQPAPPVAIVMAGIPGAGKTEFLDSLTDLLHENDFEKFVRIDLDEIVTIYPGYTPKTDYKFRSQGNIAVAKCVDEGMHNRYNMMIDGTFSGTSGVSINNVKRLLGSGYIVIMFLMYDDPNTSWKYTIAREKQTLRAIGKQEFLQSCKTVFSNVKRAVDLYGTSSRFTIYVVRQNEIRDKSYRVITKKEEIDKILGSGYNIDRIDDL